MLSLLYQSSRDTETVLQEENKQQQKEWQLLISQHLWTSLVQIFPPGRLQTTSGTSLSADLGRELLSSALLYSNIIAIEIQ